MSIGQSLLPEFDQEMATTRRVLERVPSDKVQWKPHQKSFALGHLAHSHIWRRRNHVVRRFSATRENLREQNGCN